MTPYEPGYFEKLKAKHPWPGGWREGPTEKEWAVWRQIVKKYNRWKPSPVVFDCWLPKPLKPDPAWAGQNLRISAVPNHTTERPRPTLVGHTVKRHIVRDPFQKNPIFRQIDGEPYARLAGLNADMKMPSLAVFVCSYPQIRRVRVHKKLCYYNVADFERVRASVPRRVKRD